MSRLAFIGNSLTEWFDWQGRFPAHTALNLGSAGETAEGLLLRMPEITAKAGKPDFIFLMTGTNDILMENTGGLNETYAAILIRLASAFPDAVLIVQSILPVEMPWVGNEEIKDRNEYLKKLAEDFGAAYLDLFSLFIDSDGKPKKGYLLDDGVHLSAKGYGVWADAVEEFLRDRLSA